MLEYNKIKNWCQEHKKEITVAAGFIVIFLVGFGTGRYERGAQAAKNKAQNNYSKSVKEGQKAESPQASKPQGQAAGGAAANATAASSTPDGGGEANCVIKGNLSSSGRLIYHVPSGAFYKNTNPEKCFNTEEEARAAGFVKSSR